VVRLFVLEVPASRAAAELTVNRHTVERIYGIIRERIIEVCEKEAGLTGEVEVDESYFGGQRKGKRGRGAAGKVAVFGLLKRNGRVYAQPVPNVSHTVLRAIIRQKVPPGSTIYTDGFRSYDGLVTDGYHHYRIHHEREFAQGKRNHINGIENFWGFAKTKLRRYYGIPRTRFYAYLKEMKFRFNYRNQNLYEIIMKIVKS